MLVAVFVQLKLKIMSNAKDELLEILKGKAPLKCAVISNGQRWDKDKKNVVLKLNYSEANYEKFLSEIDFDYDSGYGGQELFGTVWLDDNTWLSRGEYDGSEWWKHNVLPAVPAECLSNGSQRSVLKQVGNLYSSAGTEF